MTISPSWPSRYRSQRARASPRGRTWTIHEYHDQPEKYWRPFHLGLLSTFYSLSQRAVDFADLLSGLIKGPDNREI
jgi:hypothetical protein